MKEDQVRLDIHRTQVLNALLDMAEVLRIEAGVIVRLTLARKREARWNPVVVLVPFGEDAHAHLVEWPCLQRCQRLPLALFGLVHPGIAGGATRKIWYAVGIAEVKGVTNA